MNRKFRLTATAIAAASVALLTGCSAFSIGEENFACSGMPGDPKCMSTSDMYEYSLHGESSSGKIPNGQGGVYNVRVADPDDPVTVYAPYTNIKETEDDGLETEGQIIVGDDIIVQNFVTPKLPYSPVPVRTPSMVMRIWINSYTDMNGDLNSPGYVYTEIEPRKWVIAPTKTDGNSKSFSPLVKKPKKAEVTPVAAKKPIGETNLDQDHYNSLEKLQRDRRARGR